MSRPAPSFFTSINALRAIAALFIVFGHSVDQVEGYDWEWVALLGERGVQIFFVISGFSIEWAQASRPGGSVVDFTVRRFLRVVPTYWLATVVLALLFLRNGQTLTLWGNFVPSMLLIPHESLQQPGAVYPILMPGWTLFYEVFFYLLFGLGLALGERWRRTVVTGALLGLVLLGQWLEPQGPVLATYTSWMLAEFVVGIWLAHLVRRFGLPPVWMSLALLAGLGVFMVGNHHRNGALEVAGLALTMTGVLATEGFGPWRWKAVAWLGGAAYSLYVWHGLAMGSLLKRIVLPLSEAWSFGLMPQALLLWVLSSLAAGLVYLLVDRPMIAALGALWRRRARPARAGDVLPDAPQAPIRG